MFVSWPQNCDVPSVDTPAIIWTQRLATVSSHAQVLPPDSSGVRQTPGPGQRPDQELQPVL
eukprot:7111276-Lingulodinium_polyedra.AAC.1